MNQVKRINQLICFGDVLIELPDQFAKFKKTCLKTSQCGI